MHRLYSVFYTILIDIPQLLLRLQSSIQLCLFTLALLSQLHLIYNARYLPF